MKKNDFHFNLPPELIAAYPTERRSESRLLHLDCTTGDLTHYHFFDLIDLVNQNDLLVFNNTRVIPARLHGKKDTGGRLQLMVERILDDSTLLAQIKSSKPLKAGSKIILDACDHQLQVKGREDSFYLLEFPQPGVHEILNQSGRIPLPPYINRQDEALDKERYQTVYASKDGAVAAPTAGLHFDDDMLNRLAQKGVDSAYLTLHVGAGTFQPLRVDDLKNHKMHSEHFEIDNNTCDKVNAVKQSNRQSDSQSSTQTTSQPKARIIAVGTTTVRSLESSAYAGRVRPCNKETDIFIYPGYHFQIADAMITNFHLPESTLIMLISAFAGVDNIKKAYQLAIEEKYRFFSYGDAMLITK